MSNVVPNGELIFLFPTPVIRTNIGRSFTEEEMRCILNIPMGEKNKQEGIQSRSFEIFDIFAEKLKDIKKFCEHELKQYMEEIEGVDTDLTTLRITQSWLNRIEPQSYHPMHNHKNSYLSGILYIRCLPNDNIQLTNRYHTSYHFFEFPKKKDKEGNDIITASNAKVVLIDIKEGDFILFPSLIPHEVNRNETKDRERISLAFDTFPSYLPSLYPPYR